jgi:hypothetical protein
MTPDQKMNYLAATAVTVMASAVVVAVILLKF